MLAMETTFYESLENLKRRFGRSIPSNVLEYFLKENNGDVNRCIEALRHDGWFQPRYVNDVSPTKVVESYQSSNTRSSPPPLGSSDSSRYPIKKQQHGYRDNFQPPPPFLPKNDMQSTNETHHFKKPPTNTHPQHPDKMPVNVPYSKSRQFSVPPIKERTGHRRLSEADREVILKYQRESMEKAKKAREDIVSHLESLKIEVGRRNEEVRTLKRTNSAARVPDEDEMELAKVINDTLRMDIKEEEEKRKKRDWTCQSCSYINNWIMDQCDVCNFPRLSPKATPTSSLSTRDHNYR